MIADLETRSILETFAEHGCLAIPQPPAVTRVLSEAYQAWGAFFGSDSKFAVPGNKNRPSGYLPFCEASGCEMKESFYLQLGMSLPIATKASTRPVIEALQQVAFEVATALRAETGEIWVNNPRRACLRVLRYPALENDPESPLMQTLAADGAMRTPPHQDLNALTLQPFPTAPGLEVRMSSGEWRPVDQEPGYIIVHAGQELEARSRGRIRATLHRVRNPRDEERARTRLAMALFVS